MWSVKSQISQKKSYCETHKIIIFHDIYVRATLNTWILSRYENWVLRPRVFPTLLQWEESVWKIYTRRAGALQLLTFKLRDFPVLDEALHFRRSVSRTPECEVQAHISTPGNRPCTCRTWSKHRTIDRSFFCPSQKRSPHFFSPDLYSLFSTLEQWL